MHFNSDEAARAHIAAKFSGGKHEIGPPAYQNGDVVAYSPAQAKQIFENLMDARVCGEEIPFIAANQADCAFRATIMAQHMMHHQKIDPKAIGFTIIHLNDDSYKIAGCDYAANLRLVIKGQRIKHLIPTANIFNFHVAPTIHITQNGAFTDLILDPALCAKPATLDMWTRAMNRRLDKHPLIVQTKIDSDEHTHLTKTHLPTITEDYAKGMIATIRDLQKVLPPEQITQDSGVQENSIMTRIAASMSEARLIQKNIRERSGLDLPNCGPLALKAVLAARGQSTRE